MGNMSPYYFKTIFTLCMKCMPSFIKIGGAVSEKNGKTRHTFVVLYIGWHDYLPVVLSSTMSTNLFWETFLDHISFRKTWRRIRFGTRFCQPMLNYLHSRMKFPWNHICMLEIRTAKLFRECALTSKHCGDPERLWLLKVYDRHTNEVSAEHAAWHVASLKALTVLSV